MDIDVSLSVNIQDGKSNIQKLIVKMLEASGKIPFPADLWKICMGFISLGKYFPSSDD